MKKNLMRLLSVLLLLLVLTAGSAASAQAAESFPADGGVVYEQNGVKVTTAGLGTDPSSSDNETIVWLTLENKGQDGVWLGVTDTCVNGYTSMVYLAEYTENGSNGDYHVFLPAGGEKRCALAYGRLSVPGVSTAVPAEFSLRFTLSKEEYTVPEIRSERVVISTGEKVQPVELESLGTVVLDNDKLKLVIGQQDYDSWFGPFVYVYAENKTDRYLGLFGDWAEADGTRCDYLLGGLHLGPGMREASSFQFDSPIRELKGFEKLSIEFTLVEAESEDFINESQAQTVLEPVSVSYPPQNWGEYRNAGLTLEIQPKYNELVTVETPADDANDILFTVAETASLEAGKHEGAGWLFSIGTVSEERLHEMLCSDMSGAEAFAKDAEGRYFIKYHPTDVRYERATVEEMRADQAQWTMLNEWAAGACDTFADLNGLERVAYGNTDVDIYLARSIWAAGEKHTLSTTEFGPVDANLADGTPYVERLLKMGFNYVEGEAPDGEYVVLGFPEQDTRLDFFFAPGSYVRVVSGDRETLYQAFWYDEDISIPELMKGWYYAAAEKAGVKEPDTALDPFLGTWAEKVAGRGRVTISRSLVPGKATIEARWPNSASEETTWSMTAVLGEDGKLAYRNGSRIITEYTSSGESWINDVHNGIGGSFYLDEDGSLRWHDDLAERSEDSSFSREP
ncbi:MAG: hypothetical protein IJQ36_04945 [Oscillospiraceae bacterium]|nr:hypothetical protein [Oscillospiraceae bacterium]